MPYTRVDQGHILPRFYQRNFAHGEQIEVHIVGTGRSHVTNTAKTGTRRRAYRRTRPSGEEIDDVEWSLQHIEDAAAPILREVDQRWPLTFDDKRTVAELFAVQMVRGPAFFEHRPDLGDPTTREQVQQYFASSAVGDTERLVSMLRVTRPLTIQLASMRWTLLRFKDPVIALSDQPVVIWPLARGRADASVAPAWDPAQALEVRVPVSPFLAIVMAWFDQGDGPTRDGRKGQAKALNAFTIAQADRQWMHLPGHPPALRQGRFKPLSPQVNRGYTPQLAQRSRRRTEAVRLADRRRGAPLADRELEIVRMEPIGAGPRPGP
jgi:hypothetical protein